MRLLLLRTLPLYLQSQVLLLACMTPVVVCTAARIAQYFVRLSDEAKLLDIMRRSSCRRIWMVSLREHQIGMRPVKAAV